MRASCAWNPLRCDHLKEDTSEREGYEKFSHLANFQQSQNMK